MTRTEQQISECKDLSKLADIERDVQDREMMHKNRQRALDFIKVKRSQLAKALPAPKLSSEPCYCGQDPCVQEAGLPRVTKEQSKIPPKPESHEDEDPRYVGTVTTTGRMVSDSPNIMRVEKRPASKVRPLFVPDSGPVLVETSFPGSSPDGMPGGPDIKITVPKTGRVKATEGPNLSNSPKESHKADKAHTTKEPKTKLITNTPRPKNSARLKKTVPADSKEDTLEAHRKPKRVSVKKPA